MGYASTVNGSADLTRLIGLTLVGGMALFIHLVLLWGVLKQDRPWRTSLVIALSGLGVPVDSAKRGHWFWAIVWLSAIVFYIALWCSEL